RGSGNLRPADALAFWRWYSAWVASARFSSETDFCSFAILMAAQNEASIWASSAPRTARSCAMTTTDETWGYQSRQSSMPHSALSWIWAEQAGASTKSFRGRLLERIAEDWLRLTGSDSPDGRA